MNGMTVLSCTLVTMAGLCFFGGFAVLDGGRR